MSKINMVRQNFHSECEASINKQINMELYASYTYQSMAWYFEQADVNLPGFHKFFKKSSDEERDHAEKLMKYQNMRGGKIILQDIKRPEKEDWGTGLEAMKTALQLEKKVNESLLEMHRLGEKMNDYQMCDFLEGEYLKEQVESIKEIAGFVSQLERCGPGLGEFTFDHEVLDS